MTSASHPVRRFNEHYDAQREAYPDLVSMTGAYVTLFSGLISMFGWELLLTMAGLDPIQLGKIADRAMDAAIL